MAKVAPRSPEWATATEARLRLATYTLRLPSALGALAIARSVSPPDAPVPATALGCPRYSRPQPEAPEPPVAPRPRQTSVPPLRPRSELRNTSEAGETWMAGSAATLSPQPEAPTVSPRSSP